MPDSQRLVDLVQSRIDRDLADRRELLTGIDDSLVTPLDFAERLMRGGKRFRARFLFWGWHAVAARESGIDPLAKWSDSPDLDAVITVAAALEYFQGSALVHDDLIDDSDTRRGQPAMHRALAARHRDERRQGDSAAFGRSAALLVGDLLFGWSDELFGVGVSALAERSRAIAARRIFDGMRTDVISGQYLDLLEEHRAPGGSDGDLLTRAHKVIVYKSARYSVEAPLALGAALAGASEQQSEALRAYGLPLGVAFQLRDDLLGVFGDSSVTGKPAGDDLRAGKQTVLIAVARQKLPRTIATLLDELLGDPTLDDAQISMLRTALQDCGAVDQVERFIDRESARAVAALDAASISIEAKHQLLDLVDAATRRDA